MLESISWTTFLEGAAIACGCYYIGLAVAVYRKQIISYVNDPKAIRRERPGADDGNTTSGQAMPMAVIRELSSVLEQAGNPADKDELLAAIREILHRHKDTGQPAYRLQVQDYIISQSEEICGVRITAAELESEE